MAADTPMARPLILAGILVWAAGAGVCADQGAGAVEMTEVVTTSIGFTAIDAEFTADDDRIFVLGQTPDGQRTTLGWRSAQGLIEGDTFDLSAPQDIVLDPVRKLVFLVSQRDEVTRLTAHRQSDLQIIGSVDIDGLIYAGLFLDPEGVVLVGGIPSGKRAESVFAFELALSPDRQTATFRPAQEPVPQPDGPVSEIWYSRNDARLFASGAMDARFSALAASREPASVINYKDTLPFTVAGTVSGDVQCRDIVSGKSPSTFIGANYQLGRLLLMQYDPGFQSLDILARAAIQQDIVPGTVVETYRGSPLIVPPMKVASDCTLSTILVSNRYSTDVTQYYRPADLNGFEKVKTFKFDRIPSTIAVSPSGNFALVAFADPGSVTLYAVEKGGKTSQILSSEVMLKIREIQRRLLQAGYQIGSVDGIMGPRTETALENLFERAGMPYEPGDYDAAIKHLEDIARSQRPKPTPKF